MGAGSLQRFHYFIEFLETMIQSPTASLPSFVTLIA